MQNLRFRGTQGCPSGTHCAQTELPRTFKFGGQLVWDVPYTMHQVKPMGACWGPRDPIYPFASTRRLENSRIALKPKKSASQMDFFGTNHLMNYLVQLQYMMHSHLLTTWQGRPTLKLIPKLSKQQSERRTTPGCSI